MRLVCLSVKMTKRIQSVNFTSNEVRLLINICVKHSNIIENKETDAVNWKQKNSAWDKITNEFNAENGNIHRDKKTLRLKYDCLKRDIKSKEAKNKLEIYKTGGGTASTIQYNECEKKLLEIMAMSVEGLPYSNDSDNIQFDNVQSMSNTIVEEFVVHEDSLIPAVQNSVSCADNILNNDEKVQEKIDGNLTPTTPHLSRRKPFLKSQKKNNLLLNTKYETIAKEREKLIKIQMDNALKEQEYINNKIQLLNEESEYKQKEHELLTKKIKLEIREKELDVLIKEKKILE